MSEPSPSHGPWIGSLEKSVESILASARPLPPDDEMVIDSLTEDEEHKFFDAIRHR